MKRPGDPDEPPRPKSLEVREKEREEAETKARADAFQARLRRPLQEVSFDGAPLADVIQFLRDVTGLNLHVDRLALKAAGVDLNTPISVDARKIPAEDALQQALAAASPELRHVVLYDDVLVVSTESALRVRRDVLLPDLGTDARLNGQARKMLYRPIPEVSFNDGPHFVDVLDFIKDVTNLDVRVDWPRLKAAGVGPNAPVYIDLLQPRMNQVLQLVIREAAGDALVFAAVWDGKLIIGTAETFAASSPPAANTVAAGAR
jgi:hypothetical protein